MRDFVLFLIIGLLLTPSLLWAQEPAPDAAAQQYLNNLFLGFLFIATPLVGAIGGVVVALTYRLRRTDFIVSVLVMGLASIATTILMLAVSFVLYFNREGPGPNSLDYYLFGLVIGWPFGIFVLRHKKQRIWNGLLASAIVQVVLVIITVIGDLGTR